MVWGYLLMPLAPRFRYSEDDVVSYVMQLLQGLEYLHSRRIVHLDIKPDNIIVSGTNALKIIDFGSAQTYNPLVLRQLGRRAGTLEYMCEWGTKSAMAWGSGQGQNWGMLIPNGVHICLCSGRLGNGEEFCPWGRWEAFGVLGVSANFCSIAGVSGRVWVLQGSWGILGGWLGSVRVLQCQRGVLEGAVLECCGCLAAMDVGNAVGVAGPGDLRLL